MSERWTRGWLGEIREEIETKYEASLISPYWMPETALEDPNDRKPKRYRTSTRGWIFE